MKKTVLDRIFEGKSVREAVLESLEAKPSGGDRKNYFMFYTGSGYANNNLDAIAEFGKAHIKSLKNKSLEDIKSKHIYWATDSQGYEGMYNGDTYVLFGDKDKLPEDLKADAFRHMKR